jgi:hypothetical protein
MKEIDRDRRGAYGLLFWKKKQPPSRGARRGAKLGDGGDAPFREPAERRDGILLGP